MLEAMSQAALCLVLVLVAEAASSDYCRFSGKHTLCRYKGVAPECSHHHDREDILTMITCTIINDSDNDGDDDDQCHVR